ncbi:MAG: DUF1552 domain-containing protein [Verrucomicrobiales bacterium]|nr:DUF1552 domain-containing protein [Verrucomicrobiales bacterium]
MNNTSPLINRRFFLRSAGVTLALPLLESLSHRALGAGLAVGSQAGAAVGAARPKRLVCVGNSFGFHPPSFFPKNAGRDYDLTHLLEPIAPHRQDLTLFSGLDHGVKGGHFAIHAFLSGVRADNAKAMPEGNISLDQRAAETVGGATRFPSLTIGEEGGFHGGPMMCWTRSGMRVPPIAGPRELFRKLFISDSASDRAATADRFRLKGSILDAVHGDAKSLERRLGKRDQEKLDEYFTSVRDVERQLELGKQWANVPKPQPGMTEPANTRVVSDLPVLYDLMALALQTDSTRIATLELDGGYHGLSHHGQLPDRIDSLVKLERNQMEQFARFLAKLKSLKDGDKTLLDNTMVLFGSGMGNAATHVNTNLPVILAGGGFKHGDFKAYPQSGRGRTQLCNLYLTLLQRFGVETDRFGLSTGTLSGLEVA